MTSDEYLVKRIIELEAENNELKAEIRSLKNDKMIQFVFGTSYNLKPATYKIKLINDNISVEKEAEEC